MRHVFLDESSQNAHQFMVLGALTLPGPLVAEAEARLSDFLQHHNTVGELKWSKISRSKLDVYRGFVSHHFDYLAPQGGEYSALIVDCRDLDHRRFNEGDPDLGYNKFVYQLLFHRVAKPYGLNEKIVVDMDARNTTREVSELQNVLNSKSASFFEDPIRRPFTRVVHRCSKNSRLLQLADLMAGAVAWHKNNHDAVAGSSESKAQLANHIAQRLGLRRLGASSPRHETRLNVWNFLLQRRGGGGRSTA